MNGPKTTRSTSTSSSTRPERLYTAAELELWIGEMREMYAREEDQAIMQRNMDKAVAALSGKDACERLRNYLATRMEMHEHLLRVMGEQRRA